ncbi:MAG: DNA repair protein RadA [Rikenellaceae bacterium]|nr:DNA repair protein RadA [Rikenellaceae bacterium]
MAKVKKSWFCKSCGSESPKWLGRCPDCGEWNTFVEEVIAKESTRRYGAVEGARVERSQPVPLSQVREQNLERIDMGYPEVNRVLGGGLVPGSLVLLGGEPGIGKSTLSLQLAMRAGGLDVLYVSGEESPEQIKIRADRLGDFSENCYILAETSCQQIVDRMHAMKPGMVVIDSIQTLYSDTVESSPGSISQIRECAAILMRYAKETTTPLFIIGHITKDGAIAGPKILEHIVDVVLQFEGDPNNIYRLLRSIKNRFGATSEIGVFEMRSEGLVEVPNPSEILLSHHDEPLSGIAIGATMDGARPYLIEVQALVSATAYGTPQRTTTGFDGKRLSMLLAVIEKRLNFRMGSKDVFLNIAGGFKVSDPGLDAAVVASILSSALDKPIADATAFAMSLIHIRRCRR